MPKGRQRQGAVGDGDQRALPYRNDVVLWGRVAAPAEERELPSGDTIMTVRLIVERDAAARSRSSQRVDTIDCVGWAMRVQRVMRRWERDDRVEVEGAIRRRFFRGVAGSVSRVEVEVRSARRAASKPEETHAAAGRRR
jgi:single-strand DNA-binding protein